MDASLVVSLPEGVSVAPDGEGNLVLAAPGVRWVFRRLPAAIHGVLDRLVYPGEPFDRLCEAVCRQGVAGNVASLSYHLQRLASHGFLVVSAEAQGKRWATLAPTGPAFVFARRELGTCAYTLSRFAYLRRFGEVCVLESPLAAARIILHEPAVGQLLLALARPMTLAEMSESGAGLPAEAVEQVLRLLLAANMVAEGISEGATAEDQQPSLQPWEFHDLLFHARSREGRSGTVMGTTYSFGRRRDPLPIVKPLAGEVVELPRPDLDALRRTDPPLADVVERRRSLRQYASEPIRVEQLGEFLYRVARIRDVFTLPINTPWGSIQVDASSRPYPTSGGLFPLEFYAVVRACRGLTRGVYQYDPLGHRLGRICGQTPDVDQLLDEAAIAIAEPRETIQVLLVLTARFDRVMWKYAGFAYSLILKDVGVVFQNMYLAATAMNLAPCAIGVGNSDRFARILGADYYAETSVGEFTLGSLPDSLIPNL